MRADGVGTRGVYAELLGTHEVGTQLARGGRLAGGVLGKRGGTCERLGDIGLSGMHAALCGCHAGLAKDGTRVPCFLGHGGGLQDNSDGLGTCGMGMCR